MEIKENEGSESLFDVESVLKKKGNAKLTALKKVPLKAQKTGSSNANKTQVTNKVVSE